MKVWELMAELAEKPAGAEVVISFAWTSNGILESVNGGDEGEPVQLCGDDAHLIDDQGDERDWLSVLGSTETE